MRLSPEQARGIREATRDVFGADAVVRLFGSRVDDAARGGDIDLHVEVPPDRRSPRNEARFRAEIWKRLDEPQIDVVVMARGAAPRWIDRAALRDGIIL